MNTTICPACAKRFEAMSHRIYEGMGREVEKKLTDAYLSPESEIDANSRVKCPNCGTEFVSNAVRYFGILSATGIKVLLGFLLFSVIVIVVLQVISDMRI